VGGVARPGSRRLPGLPALNSRLVPRVDRAKIKSTRFRDYALRFVFGAGIALAAALIGTWFGPKVGGLFLGFPAILPASLTLIQKKEGRDEASVDSVGAMLGAVALVAFGVVVLATVAGLGVVPSVLIAFVVWLAVASGLYFLVALVFEREPEPP
jgi:Protein of unknown function (DUF3147)